MIQRTKLFAESWNVAWRRSSTGNILTDKDTSFHIIRNSFRYWAADPFIFDYDGETYIFAELYDYFNGRGTLGYCKFEESSQLKWKRILIEDYHMSYPYIDKVGDDIYILPETAGANELYIYKAISFPDKWEKYKVLRENVKYGDTTPFIYDNHNLAVTYDVSDKNNYLFRLLKIDEKNSVDQIVQTEDVKTKRPAGKFFIYKNNIIRPAQLCENDYGEGIIFYQVELNKDICYKEKEIDRVLPEDLKFDKNILIDGIHTYNSNLNYEIIDIKTRRFNIINLISRIVSHVIK